MIHLLKRKFTYEPITGIFTANYSSARITQGQIVGTALSHGYIVIKFNGVSWRAHRLAWFYMTGNIVERIDHIDGVKTNNAWVNLREATRSENGCNRGKQVNNTTGIKGLVHYPNDDTYGRPRYKAQIKLRGKCYSRSISYTDSKEEIAAIAELTQWLQTTRITLHGEYSHD